MRPSVSVQEALRPSPNTVDIILVLWADWLVTKPWKASNYDQEAYYELADTPFP